LANRLGGGATGPTDIADLIEKVSTPPIDEANDAVDMAIAGNAANSFAGFNLRGN
jgi:hypothetical protein